MWRFLKAVCYFFLGITGFFIALYGFFGVAYALTEPGGTWQGGLKSCCAIIAGALVLALGSNRLEDTVALEDTVFSPLDSWFRHNVWFCAALLLLIPAVFLLGLHMLDDPLPEQTRTAAHDNGPAMDQPARAAAPRQDISGPGPRAAVPVRDSGWDDGGDSGWDDRAAYQDEPFYSSRHEERDEDSGHGFKLPRYPKKRRTARKYGTTPRPGSGSGYSRGTLRPASWTSSGGQDTGRSGRTKSGSSSTSRSGSSSRRR